VIKAVVDQGARGLVIAAAGAGATSGTQEDGIRYALDKGVLVVTTSRTGGGRVSPRSSAPSAPRRQLQGEDLAPVKARILLMLALTKTQDGGVIQRMFTEY
jgi:L-asparaginase